MTLSALAGIVSPDDQSQCVTSMIAAMKHREHDGVAFHSETGLYLGIGYTRRLPEDPSAATVYAKGVLRCVCDARLDNRDDLVTWLDLSDAEVSDGMLIVEAYDRWGEGCVDRLLGDFAFAIWDPARQYLFLARDHMGVEPLFYRVDHGLIAFASERAPLVNLPAPFAPLSLRDGTREIIADLLVGLKYNVGEPFDNVRRIPPAHSVTFGGGAELRRHRYWVPSAIPLEADFEHRLRVAFIEAVKCRLRSAAPVGAFLSGGLDSTSIACCAAQALALQDRNLNTFSAVFDSTPHLSERDIIETVVRSGTFNASYVDCSDYAPFAEFNDVIDMHAAIPFAPGIGMQQLLMNEVAKSGTRSFLDGHGGDEVISHGFGRLDELARAREWRSLWKEIRGASRIFDEPASVLMSFYFLKYARFPGRRFLRQMFKLAVPIARPANEDDLTSAELKADLGTPRKGTDLESEAERHKNEHTATQ